MSEKQQRLVLSIIEFLNQSIDDGTVKLDDRESLEVASASPQLYHKVVVQKTISPVYWRSVWS